MSVLLVDEGGNVYAAAGDTLYARRDGGASWQRLATGLSRVRALALWPPSA